MPNQPVPPVLDAAIELAPATLALIRRGVASLWQRIAAADPAADERPLLLSYDVHPTPNGPVLIEVNTNAGGILSALHAARQVNNCCADAEHVLSRQRLLALFRRDLLGDSTDTIAIVDDDLDQQPLLAEMRQLARMLADAAHTVLVVDAATLHYDNGRLHSAGQPIDRVYWRSTDFMLDEPRHAPVRRALEDGAITLAPAPAAYRAIASKARLVDWSAAPVLASDPDSGLDFRLAETIPMKERSPQQWYAERRDWVFKPASGYGSRGVYVGKSISRKRLDSLPMEHYLAQRFAPHPTFERDGTAWKYDLRFFADRDQVIGIAARLFQGQVMGLRTGGGFAPVRIGEACCILGALGALAPEAAAEN